MEKEREGVGILVGFERFVVDAVVSDRRKLGETMEEMRKLKIEVY